MITCFAFFLIFNSYSYCQVCNDSLQTVRYSSASFHYDANGFRTLSTSNDEIIIALPDFSSKPFGLLIFKSDKSGHVVWHKRVVQDEGFSVSQVIEGKDKSIYIILENSEHSILISISSKGVLQWQRQFDLQNSGPINLIKITSDQQGNVYLESLVRKSVCIACFNDKGKTVWSNVYSISTATVNAINTSGIQFTGDALAACGTYNFETKDYQSNPGVWLLQLNPVTGNVIKETSYELNNANTSTDSLAFRPLGKLFYAPQAKQLVFFTELGNTDAIIRMGSDFSLKNSQQIEINDSILHYFADENCNDNAVLSYSKSEEGLNSYFLTVDTAGSFIMQKKLVSAGREYGHEAVNTLSDNSVYSIISSTSNSNLTFEVTQISPFYIDSSVCDVSAYSFAMSKPMLVTPATLNWNQEQSDQITTYNIAVNVQDFDINNETICKEKSECKSIKILGNTRLCLSDSTAVFVASRNSECLKKVEWFIDAQALEFKGFNGDTAIVKYKSPWQGYIHAKVNGCDISDSLNIFITTQKAGYLGQDTNLCAGAKLNLSPGKGYLSYRWQNGSTDSVFEVFNPGYYYVSVKDSCNHISSDSIFIGYSQKELLYDHQNIVVCQGEIIVLTANENFSNYVWSSQYDILNVHNNTISISPNTTAYYTISADDYFKCSYKDSIEVIVKDCTDDLAFPSSFTPNGDGLNDTFRSLTKYKTSYFYLTVYNRSGVIVFNSQDQLKGWNGDINSKPAASQTYIWKCLYRFGNLNIKQQYGTVVLFR